jgi:hypothetical protein
LRGEINQVAFAVGHEEIGKDLADRRHERVGAICGDALDELIVGRLEVG